MSNTSYWTVGDWEYTFLVPQGNIDEDYKSKLLAVLKKLDEDLLKKLDENLLKQLDDRAVLYVRNISLDGWDKIKEKKEMPELEEVNNRKGWALSSNLNILSGKGVLDELEKNLKEAGCSCSFMVIEGGPEEEKEEALDMNLETKDPRQTTLKKTVEDNENSGEKKNKQKPKKSPKIKLKHETQTKKIRELKERSASTKATKQHKLAPYKVISDTNNDGDNVKKAWTKIGRFIKGNINTYKHVKPIGYGTKKHWHNWHKSWVGKVFVQEDGRKFWLMKLNDYLKKKLKKDLVTFGFKIESYNDGNSKSETPTISTNPKPANMKVNSSRETEKETKQQYMQEEHTNKTKPKDNLNSANPGTTQHTIPQPPLKIAKTDHLPNELNQNQNTNPSVSPIAAPSLAEQLQQKRNKLRPTENNKNENEPEKPAPEDELVVGMKGIMKKRNKDRKENTEAGDSDHPIARFLTSRGNCKFILGLKLEKSRNDVLKALGEGDLSENGVDTRLLENIQDENGLSIDTWTEVEEYEKRMIGKNEGELGWILLIDSDSGGSVPTDEELDALQTMSKKIKELGITLVKLNSDGTIAGSKPTTDENTNPITEKTPPTSPPRNTESNPVTSASGTLDSTNANELTQNQQYGPSLTDKAKPDLVVKPRQRPNSLPAVPKNEDKNEANANEVKNTEITEALSTVMNKRRKGIGDPKAEGDPRHPIMDVLTKKGKSMYIAKLQLMKPYGKIKEKLSAEALCPDCDGEIWLAPSEDDKFDWGRYIGDAISEEIMKQCAIPTTGKEPQEWFVKVCSELGEKDLDKDFWPSVRQQEQLSEMQEDLQSKSARLVSIFTPPPLPQRRATLDPVPGDRENQAAQKGSTAKKPAKFIGLEDNVTTQGNSRQSRILVLVKYSDIEELRKAHPKETVKGVKKDKYKTFSPAKLAKALEDFNNNNRGVLKSLMLKGSRGTGQPNADGYKTVLESPVKQKYKDTGIEVSTWNLLISKPDGKPLDQDEVMKIQELVKILKDHGVAVRRKPDLKLK